MNSANVLAAAGFNGARLKQLVADIPEDKMLYRPTKESNPALWILGHLAMTAEFASSLLGVPGDAPAVWKKMFGPGSDPAALEKLAEVPTRAQLLGVLGAARERIAGALQKAGDDVVNRPHGVATMAATPLKTVGDVVVHMLTTHQGFHLAQLALIRRSLGFAPLL